MNHHLTGLIDPHLGVRQKGKKGADELLDLGHVGFLVAGCSPLGKTRRELVEDGQEPRLIRNRL